MMDKEDILKRSRREKDEGLTYAQDRAGSTAWWDFWCCFSSS